MNAEERATQYLKAVSAIFKTVLYYPTTTTHFVRLVESYVVCEQSIEKRTREGIRDALLEYAKAHSIALYQGLIEEAAEIAMTAQISGDPDK